MMLVMVVVISQIYWQWSILMISQRCGYCLWLFLNDVDDSIDDILLMLAMIVMISNKVDDDFSMTLMMIVMISKWRWWWLWWFLIDVNDDCDDFPALDSSHLFWSALPGHNITVQIEFPRLVSHIIVMMMKINDDDHGDHHHLFSWT